MGFGDGAKQRTRSHAARDAGGSGHQGGDTRSPAKSRVSFALQAAQRESDEHHVRGQELLVTPSSSHRRRWVYAAATIVVTVLFIVVWASLVFSAGPHETDDLRAAAPPSRAPKRWRTPMSRNPRPTRSSTPTSPSAVLRVIDRTEASRALRPACSIARPDR